jgi:hypothetical protein
MIRKVVSGGQTGVDRAALDSALDADIEVGGWCPRGRRAEDGAVPDRYPLDETPAPEYAQRTAWNVRDSDGTLVITDDEPAGGTARTIEEARERGRPLLHVRTATSDAVPRIVQWVEDHDVEVLNVAGPRASEADGIYERARAILDPLLVTAAQQTSGESVERGTPGAE